MLLSSSIDDQNKLDYNAITDGEFDYLLNTDYNDAFNRFNNGFKIYRGDIDIPYNITTIKPKQRTSKLDSTDSSINKKTKTKRNIYTLLLSDILPSWKDYPKRNRSFICSTRKDGVSVYAKDKLKNVHIIFPKNSAKIGICSKPDIWYSFNYALKSINTIGRELNTYDHIMDMHRFNECFMDIFNLFNIELQNNANSLLSALYSLESMIKTLSIDQVKNKNNLLLLPFLYKQIIINNKNIITALDEIFNPKDNEFELVSIKDYNAKDYKEIWTDSECLFIKYTYAKNIELI